MSALETTLTTNMMAATKAALQPRTMQERTAQDLLAERRYNVQEARHETDATAIAMLNAHVSIIDVELARRRV